jgi:[lysine-biosynthesis-protein LysW]--L-2-aminoadipate ligase
MKIGFLHSLLRKDEKLLLQELKSRRNVEIVLIDDREINLTLTERQSHYGVDVIVERCINHYRALHALKFFESEGIKCVNSYAVADTCGSKFLTSVALRQHQVPHPEVKIAFTESSALRAIEEIGYPVVLKPAVGSWGRLLSKINDRESAEAILEHKTILGTYHHSVFYIQKYVNKGNSDIRSFVVGEKCIAAIYRNSNHWITNTAKGSTVSNCPVTEELATISLAAAKAVGGGILAIDIFKSPQGDGFLVNEVNYTMEFKNSIVPTSVNIPSHIVDYLIAISREPGNG